MGWFSKKEEVKRPNMPSLPELPKLPELNQFQDNSKKESQEIRPIHQLPSYPNSSLGDKFSQDTIKEAVTGRKEVEGHNADDFALGDEERMQGLPKRARAKEMEDETHSRIKPRETKVVQVPHEFKHASRIVKNNEPIFIRIDKFEESLKLFDKTKEKIHEIEKLLAHINQLKEEEEKELSQWENELKTIKEQIDKVDRDIFSKVE